MGPFHEPKRCASGFVSVCCCALRPSVSVYDLLLCSETLVSDKRHISELLVPGFGRSVLLRRDGMPWARGMAAYVRDGYGAYRQPKF